MVIIYLLCLSAFAVPKQEQLAGKIVPSVQAFFKKSGATAASIAIFSKDSWVFEGAYGSANATSRYDMASLTKPLSTTLAVLWLIDQGHGKLNEPISETIPGIKKCLYTYDRFPEHAKKLKWKAPPPTDPEVCAKKSEITVEQIMRHRSGFRDYVPLEGVAVAAPEMGVDPIDLFTESPILSQPGAVFQYADINFIILQRWIQAKLNQRGKTFQGLMKTVLFPALSLNESDFFSQSIDPSVIPFVPTLKDVKLGHVHDPFSYALAQNGDGHAGLFSSLGDIKKIAQFWLEGGQSQSPLKSETIQLATSDTDDHLPGARRGLGWDIDSQPYSIFVRGPIQGGFGHTGYTGTSIWIEPKSKLIAIVLTNRTYLKADAKSVGATNDLRQYIATLGWELSSQK
ncbi:MAG: beta-lactamase family protein [Xanthomonadaceae bacterium]|nr:beta-lactamase family protein [Xanthomonadaceae bacterium]